MSGVEIVVGALAIATTITNVVTVGKNGYKLYNWVKGQQNKDKDKDKDEAWQWIEDEKKNEDNKEEGYIKIEVMS